MSRINPSTIGPVWSISIIGVTQIDPNATFELVIPGLATDTENKVSAGQLV